MQWSKNPVSWTEYEGTDGQDVLLFSASQWTENGFGFSSDTLHLTRINFSKHRNSSVGFHTDFIL